MPDGIRKGSACYISAIVASYSPICQTSPFGLVVTSPPYNIGKHYERAQTLHEYVSTQSEVIAECVRVLADDGSLCWQTGNYVRNGEIVPLGRAPLPQFSMIWDSKCEIASPGISSTDFTVQRDYPDGTRPFRGSRSRTTTTSMWIQSAYRRSTPTSATSRDLRPGSCPAIRWARILVMFGFSLTSSTITSRRPSIPANSPVELVERLVLSMTEPDDWVLDPYMGVASAAIGSLRHGRRSVGAELDPVYHAIGVERVEAERYGLLRTRPMNRPVYQPPSAPRLL